MLGLNDLVREVHFLSLPRETVYSWQTVNDFFGRIYGGVNERDGRGRIMTASKHEFVHVDDC